MDGDPPAGPPPRSPSLIERIIAAGPRCRRGWPRPDARWRGRLTIVAWAAIAGLTAIAGGAWVAGLRTRQRIEALRPSVADAAARRMQIAEIAARFRTPGLDARLTRLARNWPESAELIEFDDRRIVLRVTDPDRLRERMQSGGLLAEYAERGQTIAPDGGIDVELERR